MGRFLTQNESALRHAAEAQFLLPEKLHEYQWEGVSFLCCSPSALLADEMGLGKTVQAAVAMALLMGTHSEIDRALIVAPASLITNWMQELAAWAPSLTVRCIQGSQQDRNAYYLLPIPVLVGSYEQIRKDALDQIPSNSFDLVVLDEAQRIKNRSSTTALACKLLPRKRSWALSATPLENDRSDVESIFEFLNVDSPSQCEHAALSFSGLQRRLTSMMLRRRKAEVRGELPPVLTQDIRLELTPLQQKEYDSIWIQRAHMVSESLSHGDSTSALLGLLTRLKIICNFVEPDGPASSKLEALKVICEGTGNDARILVFSQFVETLKFISASLDMPHDLVIGSMDMARREEAMNRFRSGTTPRLLLVSLRAGGVGLNLGEATHVVLFDRWWNPAVEQQAVYRAHRFDRDIPLHVIRFLVTSTVEERIAEILDVKERLFYDTIETVPAEAHKLSFSAQELMSILELSTNQIAPKKRQTKEE